jgi:hypothetical protein
LDLLIRETQELKEKITYVIIGLDHHQINVAAGAHVVEDTSCNGVPLTKNEIKSQFKT